MSPSRNPLCPKIWLNYLSIDTSVSKSLAWSLVFGLESTPCLECHEGVMNPILVNATCLYLAITHQLVWRILTGQCFRLDRSLMKVGFISYCSQLFPLFFPLCSLKNHVLEVVCVDYSLPANWVSLCGIIWPLSGFPQSFFPAEWFL